VEDRIVGLEVTMFLCDAAESVGGKLYILGGGWSQINNPGIPTNMALAIKLSVPWDRANEPLGVRATLLTEDGQPVILGPGPIRLEGEVEVGRPPGLKRGTPLDFNFVLNFPGIALGPGGYVWELEIDDELMARAPVRVFGGAGSNIG
jgi:hypothetical protein